MVVRTCRVSKATDLKQPVRQSVHTYTEIEMAVVRLS